ncbi:MAG: alpha-amylase, partial [Chloroflexota bacterium]
MAEWANKPFVYQINTWVWLTRLSRQLGKTITLSNIPDNALDEIALPGLDMIWLMGVWTRSTWG